MTNLEALSGVARVRLTTTSLQGPDAEAICREIFARVEGLVPHRVELDLGNVRYLTASALGGLVLLHRRLRDSGGSLVLTNVSAPVGEVLEVSGLTRLFRIHRPSGPRRQGPR